MKLSVSKQHFDTIKISFAEEKQVGNKSNLFLNHASPTIQIIQ